MRLLLGLVLIGMGCWILADALAVPGDQLAQSWCGGGLIGFGIMMPAMFR